MTTPLHHALRIQRVTSFIHTMTVEHREAKTEQIQEKFRSLPGLGEYLRELIEEKKIIQTYSGYRTEAGLKIFLDNVEKQIKSLRKQAEWLQRKQSYNNH